MPRMSIFGDPGALVRVAGMVRSAVSPAVTGLAIAAMALAGGCSDTGTGVATSAPAPTKSAGPQARHQILPAQQTTGTFDFAKTDIWRTRVRPDAVSGSQEIEILDVPVPVLAKRRVPQRRIADTIEQWSRTAAMISPPQPRMAVRPPRQRNINRRQALAGRDIRSPGAMGNFFAALRDLESGNRNRPVRILHIGDSHIASDTFTRGIRRRFQQRFGDAGRGMMQPPKSFRWHSIEDMRLSTSGGWKFFNSLTHKSGPYGITGVRATASVPGAILRVSARSDRFDRATLRYLTSPDGGKVELKLGGKSLLIDTRSATRKVRSARIQGSGSQLQARALGGGPVTVLGWSLEKNQPGIQYISLGIPGAAAYVARAWRPEIIAADIKDLAPDLIVFGFGSNEALNTSLTRQSYGRHVRAILGQLMKAAPRASLLVLGPADGARKAGNGRATGRQRCSTRVAGDWYTLPRLAVVQDVLRATATRLHAAYWDWAKMMGGLCSVGQWASMSPPLAARDHLHLSSKGYDRSSAALYNSIMSAFEGSQMVATRR